MNRNSTAFASSFSTRLIVLNTTRPKICIFDSRVATRKPRRPAVMLNRTDPDTPVELRTLLPRESATVQTLAGDKVDIVDALLESRDDAVIVGWLRHYGCTLCAKQTKEWDTELRQKVNDGPCKNSKKSVRIVLVGSGSSEQARDFKTRLDYSGELLTDPELKTYETLRFARGAGSVFNLPALIKTIKSFASGHSQRWSMRANDPLLQGGSLVVDKDGVVVMLHRDKYAGDHASIESLVSAVQQAFAGATAPAGGGTR